MCVQATFLPCTVTEELWYELALRPTILATRESDRTGRESVSMRYASVIATIVDECMRALQ
jgi:hypothetical protein